MGTGFDIATSPEEEGIIPRAVAHLFEGIDRRKHDAKERNEPQPDFKITVQFMEVHMYMLTMQLPLVRGEKLNYKFVAKEPKKGGFEISVVTDL